MLNRIFRALGPVVALAAGTLVAGCDSHLNVQIGDSEGVPLAELDQSGPAPQNLVLAGPDEVIISDGSALKIEVSGDRQAVEALRFSLDEGTLGIMREKASWKDKGQALVRVTMPSPESITLAGSGTVEAASLADKASLTIAGSGKLKAETVATRTLDVTIAGSGSLAAKGRSEKMDMTIAGSGDADMAGLGVEDAKVTIAGSGGATFSSDGMVDASIMGSGSVHVIGRAECKVSAMGSGTLRCSQGTAKAGKSAPKAPAAPQSPDIAEAPDAPEAPQAPGQ